MAALEYIKREYQNVKVIMCSAVTDKTIIDSTIVLGASGYITKPFMPAAIIASLGMI